MNGEVAEPRELGHDALADGRGVFADAAREGDGVDTFKGRDEAACLVNRRIDEMLYRECGVW